MKKYLVLSVLVCIAACSATVFADEARLLREPAVSSDHVAFIYANDLWITARDGGRAHRLTTHVGEESNPQFSPDGKWIAFTGQYDGNTDVYIIPVTGGEPKRLTWHSSADVVRGWTSDGSAVIFMSGRFNVPRPLPRLWKISTDGGMPEVYPMPEANRGSFSPDESRIAYVRVLEAFGAWRHYRGGRTTRIWLMDMDDYDVEKIPQQDNSNDTYPMWIGDKVYFLSDRNHTMNLFSFDTNSKEIAQLTQHDDFDVKNASAGPGVIAYEQAGYINLYDLKSGTSDKLEIEVAGDMPWSRPHWEDVSNLIFAGSISPTGARAVFSARGDIFTVPAEKGDARNLSTSSGANDRWPAWSPDGKWIAWWSDASGEYQLMIRDQKGEKPARAIALENPTFYYRINWSPDSKKILYTDKKLNAWYLDVESGKTTRVDTDLYDHPWRSLEPVWSPDSAWIAYAKRLPNFYRAIFVYSLEDGKSYQITDGLSDAVSPAFDKSGKYLYFLASTNFGPTSGWLDMTSYEKLVRRSMYYIVLSAEGESPLLPESDEEKVKEEKAEEKGEDKSNDKKPEKKDEGVIVKIDFDGIAQRILAIDIPERQYSSVQTGGEGIIFYLEAVLNERGGTLHRYTLKDRKAEEVTKGVNSYDVSFDGKKILVQSMRTWSIINAAGKPKPGEGKLNTAGLRMYVDPELEWKQIYKEGWRINRDYFYDPEMHGADWPAMYDKYEPWLAHVRHRSDLGYVLSNLIGELTCGHSWAFGGDMETAESVNVGHLGADYEIANGYYKFAKIYNGENWNPDVRAPLTVPGSVVKEGEYLLMVNGREVTAPTNIYSYFEGLAGQQIPIVVNSEPSMDGSRTVTVVPVASENDLRMSDWVEGNRRKVDEMSGGKLAYIYLPNTTWAGFINFNRYYYAQQNKQGAVIDERWNGGGSVADYFVDMMDRKIISYFATRDGEPMPIPTAMLYGPKVMLINEYAGSGGDFLPYAFRHRGIGPLIGTTTWGGLVGHHEVNRLIDGGIISSPNLAFYDLNGEWDVENVGVAPDIEVEQMPGPMINGHDPQLEAGVKEALRLIEEKPFKPTPRPKPIDRVTPK